MRSKGLNIFIWYIAESRTQQSQTKESHYIFNRIFSFDIINFHESNGLVRKTSAFGNLEKNYIRVDILTTVFLIFVAQRSAKSAKKCLCTLYNKISMLSIYLLKITSFLICCIWCCCSVIPLFRWYPLLRQCSAFPLPHCSTSALHFVDVLLFLRFYVFQYPRVPGFV